MTIDELIEQSHGVAVASGFYDDDDNDEARRDPNKNGTRLMLMVSELAEALEDIRKGNWDISLYDTVEDNGHDYARQVYHPTGLPIELADLAIRLGDYCGWLGIDLQGAIKIKAEYNKTRPYKHGKTV